MKPFGLYISLPFCIARCAFCAFSIQGYREGWANRYLLALQKEIGLVAKETLFADRAISSIYLGGGTPTLYPPDEISSLLSLIRGQFNLGLEVEVTLEAHPATIDRDNLSAYRQAGVNRLSIGVQSFRDEDLALLGRNHTAHEVYAAYAAARAAGFLNIGIDLIYGLPGQTLDAWEENLVSAIALAPDHLSLYALSIEEGTLFHRQADRLSLPSEETTLLQYEVAQTRLARAGLDQYEISNFARPGFFCRHNLLYWDRGEVLGVGLDAHSYLERAYRANTEALSDYLLSLEQGRLPIVHLDPITAESAQTERIVFGLRKTAGLSEDLFRINATLSQKADRLLSEGLLLRHQGTLRLTQKGMHFADEVAVALL